MAEQLLESVKSKYGAVAETPYRMTMPGKGGGGSLWL